jgi:uncharacterized repeat protein (TIGR01451 family)
MFVNKVRLLLLSGTAIIATAGTAEAAQTPAGTTITNTASVTYTVNGSPQTTNSTTATFVVDRKVNFTLVTDQTANTTVNVGQTGAVTKFKLTNTTNGTQDFLLDSAQAVPLGALLGSPDFTLNNIKIFVDANGNGVYDPGTDLGTYVDELAPDASVEIFIVGDVPATGASTLAQVALHATVANGGGVGVKGTALLPTDLNLANADNTVDIVFADNDSDGLTYLGDIARNGQGIAYAAYEAGTRNVALTVTKTARVLSDDVNLLVNPKALPGAIVEYCLTVNNATALVAANNVVLTDVVPSDTTYVPGTLTIGLAGVLGTSCTLSTLGTTTGYTGAYNSSTKTVTATIPSVGGLATVAASFQVKIN